MRTGLAVALLVLRLPSRRHDDHENGAEPLLRLAEVLDDTERSVAGVCVEGETARLKSNCSVAPAVRPYLERLVVVRRIVVRRTASPEDFLCLEEILHRGEREHLPSVVAEMLVAHAEDLERLPAGRHTALLLELAKEAGDDVLPGVEKPCYSLVAVMIDGVIDRSVLLLDVPFLSHDLELSGSKSLHGDSHDYGLQLQVEDVDQLDHSLSAATSLVAEGGLESLRVEQEVEAVAGASDDWPSTLDG